MLLLSNSGPGPRASGITPLAPPNTCKPEGVWHGLCSVFRLHSARRKNCFLQGPAWFQSERETVWKAIPGTLPTQANYRADGELRPVTVQLRTR